MIKTFINNNKTLEHYVILIHQNTNQIIQTQTQTSEKWSRTESWYWHTKSSNSDRISQSSRYFRKCIPWNCKGARAASMHFINSLLYLWTIWISKYHLILLWQTNLLAESSSAYWNCISEKCCSCWCKYGCRLPSFFALLFLTNRSGMAYLNQTTGLDYWPQFSLCIWALNCYL